MHRLLSLTVPAMIGLTLVALISARWSSAQETKPPVVAPAEAAKGG